MNPDILDRLAVYAPTATSVAGEWGPGQREEGLATVLDDDPDGGPAGRRLHFVPTTRTGGARALAPIAASVAVLVLAGGAAVLADRERGSGASPAGDPASGPTSRSSRPNFHATVDTPRLGAHQWAYRATSSRATSDGSGRSAVWITRDGSAQRFEFDGSTATCAPPRTAVHDPAFNEPTQAFVDALPTDPAALKAFLTKRVQGSTSREEAIFTAVGDLLRDGDLLASSDQRAALVSVLAGLQRTAVHDDTDERGRAAVRIDFVDANQRGDEIQSLYFDTRTFQLLEERESSSDAAVPTAEPSAPYTSEPSDHPSSPQHLTAKGSVTVMTAEQVVDTLPSNCGVAK